MCVQVFKKLYLKLIEIFRFVINTWTTLRIAGTGIEGANLDVVDNIFQEETKLVPREIMTEYRVDPALAGTVLFAATVTWKLISFPSINQNPSTLVADGHGEIVLDEPLIPVNGSNTMPRIVFSAKLSNLAGGTIELDPLATPRHFRLLDCSAFLDSDELRIIEYPQRTTVSSSQAFKFDISSSPLPPFAAISYPWRDLQHPSGSTTPSFSVSGATHADPISIDILHTACLAARMFSCDYIWLDRLCILQTQKEDKNWQIKRMFRIYKACDTCLVLPGGLVRLAGLDEPTTWIDRAWTLQEVVAPGEMKAKCIFSFTHPTYRDFLEEQCNRWMYSDRARNFLLNRRLSPVENIVEAGRSALCSLDLLFRVMWGWAEWLRCFEFTLSGQHEKFPIRIMYDPAISLLRRALLPSHRDLRVSAYTRSSSRPLDMVFSLMDLSSDSLDVNQYTEDDRLKATIKLI